MSAHVVVVVKNGQRHALLVMGSWTYSIKCQTCGEQRLGASPNQLVCFGCLSAVVRGSIPEAI